MIFQMDRLINCLLSISTFNQNETQDNLMNRRTFKLFTHQHLGLRFFKLIILKYIRDSLHPLGASPLLHHLLQAVTLDRQYAFILIAEI